MTDHVDQHGALRSRFRGCLTGVAVGDAFGAPFEGAASVTEAEWAALVNDPRPLAFTDDTHMTFGVVESLLAQGRFDGENMARIFMRDYDAEPWRGYGPGPPRIFSMIKSGTDWSQAAKILYDGGSFGNGAAMRSAPIGLRYFRDLPTVVDVARRSASITHAHDLGMEGAAAQACAVGVLVGAERPLERDLFVKEVVAHLDVAPMTVAIERAAALAAEATPQLVAREIGNSIEAIEAVPAAFAAFLANAGSFSETVAFAVAIGGDTDTIASMAGALSGAHLGGEAIPRSWRDRAEGAGSMARVAGLLFDHAIDHPPRG